MQTPRNDELEKLDDEIEELDDSIHKMDETEVEEVVSGLSMRGMTFRRDRKDVRYKLYRLRTEADGGPASEVDEEFKKKFEEHDLFGGWRFFAITWDVAFDDPFRCVHRDKSGVQEWDELVKAKFPQVGPGGKVAYPDINVRKKVEKNLRKEKKKKLREESKARNE